MNYWWYCDCCCITCGWNFLCRTTCFRFLIHLNVIVPFAKFFFTFAVQYQRISNSLYIQRCPITAVHATKTKFKLIVNAQSKSNGPVSTIRNHTNHVSSYSAITTLVIRMFMLENRNGKRKSREIQTILFTSIKYAHRWCA